MYIGVPQGVKYPDSTRSEYDTLYHCVISAQHWSLQQPNNSQQSCPATIVGTINSRMANSVTSSMSFFIALPPFSLFTTDAMLPLSSG